MHKCIVHAMIDILSQKLCIKIKLNLQHILIYYRLRHIKDLTLF